MKKTVAKLSKNLVKQTDGKLFSVCKTLISVSEDINTSSWSLDHADLPLLRTPLCWSVRKKSLCGGKQEGVDIIEVNNGQMRFVVIPTRGMSILRVDCGDVRLGWDSPVKEVVHPKLINLESRGGLGWLEGFNEWMVRCGVEWAGHPGRDKFLNSMGDEVEMYLTLHGKIGNTPASEVEVLIEKKPPHRIHIRGLVEERMFHGSNLSLWTDISTELGSTSLRIEDTLENQDVHEQEFQMIYHANFGTPLLGDGSRFIGAIKKVTPFNSHAAKSAGLYSEYHGPQSGVREQVYCLQPLAGPDGNGLIMLQNKTADRGVSMSFPVQQLPCVTLWKNLASVEEGYVTGMEPGTGFPHTRKLERKAGRVPKLMPGEKRKFVVDVNVLTSRNNVEAARQRIACIQGKTRTIIDGF